MSRGAAGGRKLAQHVSWLWRGPRRALCAARDLYVRSLTSCAGHLPRDAAFGYPTFAAAPSLSGFASASSCSDGACDAHDSDHHAPPKATIEPPQAVSAAGQQVPSPPQFLPQGWAVDELLQFSDYESSDKARR